MKRFLVRSTASNKKNEHRSTTATAPQQACSSTEAAPQHQRSSTTGSSTAAAAPTALQQCATSRSRLSMFMRLQHRTCMPLVVRLSIFMKLKYVYDSWHLLNLHHEGSKQIEPTQSNPNQTISSSTASIRVLHALGLQQPNPPSTG